MSLDDKKTSRLNSCSEDKVVEQPRDDIIKYRCEPCQANFATEADWRFHLDSEYHRQHASKK